MNTGRLPDSDRFWDRLRARVAPMTEGQRRWLHRAIVAAAFVVCVAALTREPAPDLLVSADLNAPVSNKEIRAAFYFESIDLKRTQEERDAQIAKVPEYFGIDTGLVEKKMALLREDIVRLREPRVQVQEEVVAALMDSTAEQPAWTVVERAVAGVAAKLRSSQGWDGMPAADLLAIWLLPDAKSVPERVFPPETGVAVKPAAAGAAPQPVKPVRLNTVAPDPLTFNDSDRLGALSLEGLEAVLNQGIRVSNLDAQSADRRIVIQRAGTAASQTEGAGEMRYGQVPSPEDAVRLISAVLMDAAKRIAPASATQADWARMHDAALGLARRHLWPTLVEEKVATAAARARAAEATPLIMKEIEAGEIIQDGGKRWTSQSRQDVKTYLDIIQKEERPLNRLINSLFAHAILVILAILALSKATRLLQGGMVGLTPGVSARKAFDVTLVLLCMVLASGRLSSYFEPSGFVVPVAAAGILCAILVNAPVAGIFSGIMAVLISAQYQYNWRLMLVAGAMAVAGAFSVTRVRRRSDMMAASLMAMVAGLLATAAVTLSTESLFAETFLRRLMLIALNGGFCMVAVPGLLSPLERMFRMTTDITLLEYSDLNNPVLNELAMKAPATYAHSLLLGQLAESAADAIGANGLLARVCAYYHDIGKMANTSYFSENQSGFNVHDTLPPEESVARIREHVLEGAELARRYYLPKPIIDGILEHHGTTLVSYFFSQAVERYGAGKVVEADYRYPGPRPQRPETAILMICDASESGVRSLDNPDEAHVRAFVRNLVDIRAKDGQFDECNLTFRHLAMIIDVVVKGVVNAMHTRVRYPNVTPAKKG